MEQVKKDKLPESWSIISPFDGVWEISYALPGNERSREVIGEAILVMLEYGKLEVVVDGFKKIVKSGEMFIIPPGSTYRSKTLEESQAILCHFSVEIIPRIQSMENDLESDKKREEDKGLKTLELNRILSKYLNLLESYLEQGIPARELYKLKRQELFYLIFSSYSKEELASFLHTVTREGMPFRIFVMKNWKNARNVVELAAMNNLSTSGFVKKFKKYFNESPYKWITCKKVESILEEVVENKLPLKAIADKYHFANYAHFGTFCKAQYSVSPKNLLSYARKKLNS